MKKLVILSLIAPALGLAACGGPKVDNTVVSNDVVANVDDMNTMSEDNAAMLNDTVPVANVANAN